MKCIYTEESIVILALWNYVICIFCFPKRRNLDEKEECMSNYYWEKDSKFYDVLYCVISGIYIF